MAQIGAYSVYSISGVPEQMGMGHKVSSRPGVNGYDIVLLGGRSEPSALVVKHDFTSAGNMKAGVVSLMGLKGQVVSVSDDFGNVWSNLLVERVVVKSAQRVTHAVGGFNAGVGSVRYFVEFDVSVRHLG